MSTEDADRNDTFVPGVGHNELLAGRRVKNPATAEVKKQAAQSVENRLPLIDLDSADDMRPMPHHDIAAVIHHGVEQLDLKAGGSRIVGTRGLVRLMQHHGLKRHWGWLVVITRGLMRMNGKEHDIRSGLGFIDRAQ